MIDTNNMTIADVNKYLEDLYMTKNKSEVTVNFDVQEAAETTKKYDSVSQRHSKFMKHLYDLCNLCGYQIEGRIKLRDRKSGRLFE